MEIPIAKLLECLSEQHQDSSPKPKTKGWSADEWEAYLISFESPLRESQIAIDHFDRLAASNESSIFDFAQEAANPQLTEAVRFALAKLSSSQRRVIQLTYFNLMSTREIAKSMGISQSAVCNLKKRALRNLRKLLEGVFTSTLVSKQEQENDND